MTLATVLVAISAAVAFGWSTAAMHSTAFGAPGHVESLPSLLKHVIADKKWLSGMAASLSGLGLHAFALSLGSLVIVQPIVATGLLWALAFGDILARRKPNRSIVVWAIIMVAGLTLFFSTNSSTPGRASASALPAGFMLGIGGAVAALCWLLAPKVSPRRAGLLLGTGAGVIFGLVAGTLKATTATTGVVDLFTHWPVYVLLALGAAGFSLNQAAYNKVPLSQSLPILNTVNPIVALTYGVTAFAEHPTGSALTIFAETLGLLITLAAVFMLAREGDDILEAQLDHRASTSAQAVG